MRGADDPKDQALALARMSKHSIRRIVSVLVGATVVFGLEQGLGVKFYFAIPAGVTRIHHHSGGDGADPGVRQAREIIAR